MRGLLLSLCLAAFSAPAAVRPEVARLLPPDAVTVGGFEVAALRDTPLFGRLASRFPIHGDEQLDQIFALAGFDPKRDIHRILASGEGGNGPRAKATLVILQGNLDVHGSAHALLNLFSPVGEHGGFTLYETVSKRGNPNGSIFAFLDPETAVLGPRDRVIAAIDRWRAPGEPSKAALAALAQHEAHVWAATLEPSELIGPWIDSVPGGGGPLRAIAGAMQSLAIRATSLAGAVHAEMAFLCGDSNDARSLADAAQTIAAFGALTSQRERPELAKLLGQVRIDQQDAETTLSIDLTEEQVLNLH